MSLFHMIATSDFCFTTFIFLLGCLTFGFLALFTLVTIAAVIVSFFEDRRREKIKKLKQQQKEPYDEEYFKDYYGD